MAQVLRVLSMMENGARPTELANALGITTLQAALLLSRYRKQGIVLKRESRDGHCRYCLSSKGVRKLAYLELVESEREGGE